MKFEKEFYEEGFRDGIRVTTIIFFIIIGSFPAFFYLKYWNHKILRFEFLICKYNISRWDVLFKIKQGGL